MWLSAVIDTTGDVDKDSNGMADAWNKPLIKLKHNVKHHIRISHSSGHQLILSILRANYLLLNS